MIGRREILVAAAAGIGALAARPAEACTFVSDPHTRFSDETCLAALQAWIDLLNGGPDTLMERVTRLADEMSVSIEEDMVAQVLGERMDAATDRQYIFYKEFRLSGGRSDPRPIRIAETHMVRRLRNRASYQFTMERYSYVPETVDDGSSCFLAEPEHHGTFRTSYLATFWSNRMRTVKQFPEWYLEDTADG